MSIWTAKCWLDVQFWISNDTQWPVCKIVNLENDDLNLMSKRSKNGRWPKTKTVFQRWASSLKESVKVREFIIKAYEWIVKNINYELKHFSSKRLKKTFPVCSKSSSLLQLEHDEPFARFGHSLVAGDFNGDRTKELGIMKSIFRS